MSFVEAHPLRSVFRHAHGHVLKLRTWADRAKREGLFDVPGMKAPLPNLTKPNSFLALTALDSALRRHRVRDTTRVRHPRRARRGAAPTRTNRTTFDRAEVVDWHAPDRLSLIAGGAAGPDDGDLSPVCCARRWCTRRARGRRLTRCERGRAFGDFQETFHWQVADLLWRGRLSSCPCSIKSGNSSCVISQRSRSPSRSTFWRYADKGVQR